MDLDVIKKKLKMNVKMPAAAFFLLLLVPAVLLSFAPREAKGADEGAGGESSGKYCLEWETMFGHARQDRALGAAGDGEDGFVIVGETQSCYGHGAGGSDVLFARVNEKGSLMWQKRYGGTGDDRGYAVAPAVEGGYLLAGATRSFNDFQDENAYLLRVDREGLLQWQKVLGGPGEEVLYDARQTSDGGWIAVGETGSFSGGRTSVYLVRLDSGGRVLWEKSFCAGDAAGGSFVREEKDGGCVVAGHVFTPLRGRDVYLLKTDARGSKVWERTFGGAGWECIETITFDAGGGYLLGGWSTSTPDGNVSAFIIRTGPGETGQWEKTFDGPGWKTVKAAAQTADGAFLLGGWEDRGERNGTTLFILKIAPNGEILRESTLNGEKFRREFPLLFTGDEGVLVIGWWEEPLKNRQWKNEGVQGYVAKVRCQ
ncbi:MAG: hypothetical protein K6U74_16805 [Firmicutes bacterium]|nr:hypothetical protein [Bacillota bacterium]